MKTPRAPGCCTACVASNTTGQCVAAQDRERAHVDDEIVVAERDAALADEQRLVARRARLVDDVRHFPGREELALLEVDRLALARDGDDEVRLPAQQRRRLQHVDDRGDLVERSVLVDVGEHRHFELRAHALEDPQALLDAEAAKARRASCDWPCRTTP